MLYNRDSVPQFTTANPRCTIIAHREFIKDIQGSVGFQNDQFNINASNPAVFPWLSQIARNFEQVVFQGIVFEYKTTCANAIGSTNTALGTVVMATQYDVMSDEFTNKQQMENYEFAQSTSPSASIMHAIECDPKLTHNQGLFYIPKANDIKNDNDPRMSNIGRFNIATVGMQASAVIGELWVTYKVCLLKPKLTSQVVQSDAWILDAAEITDFYPYGKNPELRPNSTSAQYNFDLKSDLMSTTRMSDQNFTALGLNPWVPSRNAVINAIFFNPSFTGFALVVYQLHGGVIPKIDPTLMTEGNCRVITSPALADAHPFISYVKAYSATPGVNADSTMYTFIVKIDGGFTTPDRTPAVRFESGVPGSPTFGNLAIFAIPGNLYED